MPMKEWIVVVGLGRMNKYINWILFNVWKIWQYFRDNDIENYVWKNEEFTRFSVHKYLTHMEMKTSGTDSSFTGHKDLLLWEEISFHVFGVKIYASQD